MANQTEIPVIHHADKDIVQIQQNVNKVLRNLNNQTVSVQDQVTNLPAFPSPITSHYWTGHFPATTFWTHSASTSFVDMATISGSGTLTTSFGNLTVTAAGSSLPGITLTPATTSDVFYVTASSSAYSSVVNADGSVRLYDGTSLIADTQYQQQSGVAGALFSFTLSGVWAPAVTTAVTIKVQMASSSGTLQLGTGGGVASSLFFTVIQIN